MFQVACATPGLFTYIDYSKSDAWAVGTIAYELLTDLGNPFYRSVSGASLRNTTYSDSDLPAMGETVPPVIVKLVQGLLARNPNQVSFIIITRMIAHHVLVEHEWSNRNIVKILNHFSYSLLGNHTEIQLEQLHYVKNSKYIWQEINLSL